YPPGSPERDVLERMPTEPFTSVSFVDATSAALIGWMKDVAAPVTEWQSITSSTLELNACHHSLRGLPRLWRLFSYILPKPTRDRVFEPAYQETLEDYIAIRSKYHTEREKQWLAVCFTWHTAWMVVECVAAMLSDRALALARRLWPGLILWWWLRK